METDHGCKVCRVLDDRGLDGYDERLLSRWRGEEGQREGYRQLAEWLNVTLLRREMDEVGLSTLGGEAQSKYDRLQEDDASAREIETMLEREGVDVDRLRSDFVSYGVVRTHITECLGAEFEPTEESEWEEEAIDIARDRAHEKIVEGVESLSNKGKIAAPEEVTVHLNVELECEACQTRVPLRRALRRGRLCDCDSVQLSGSD